MTSDLSQSAHSILLATKKSEVPADHQGLGRAIPRFLRTKCAIKCVLCLLFSSPGDVALCAGQFPHVYSGAIRFRQVLGHPHELSSPEFGESA